MCAECYAEDRVQVVLSTCNGQQYLREQLQSLESIARVMPYCVLIRDDGSTDGTREILKEYEKLSHYHIVYGENVGMVASYRWLFENCDTSCRYFALCDQDDRWLPNKMELAHTHLKDFDDVPALFFSRSVTVDSQGRPIGETMQILREPSFYNALVQNPCPGHTQVFNRKLLMLLRKYQDTADYSAPDWFVYLIASALGKILFSPQCTVLYRQHMANSSGYRVTDISRRFRRIKGALNGQGAIVSRQISGILQCVGKNLPEPYYREAKSFIDSQSSFEKRLVYILHSKIYRQSKLDTFLFRWIYLFGAYKF